MAMLVSALVLACGTVMIECRLSTIKTHERLGERSLKGAHLDVGHNIDTIETGLR
jgi:hypothetical protein